MLPITDENLKGRGLAFVTLAFSAVNVLVLVTEQTGGVAYMAHVGGFVGGMIGSFIARSLGRHRWYWESSAGW